jgi:hypothetical protein
MNFSFQLIPQLVMLSPLHVSAQQLNLLNPGSKKNPNYFKSMDRPTLRAMYNGV